MARLPNCLKLLHLEPDPLLAEAKSGAVDYYRETIGMTMVNETQSTWRGSHALTLIETRQKISVYVKELRYGNPQPLRCVPEFR